MRFRSRAAGLSLVLIMCCGVVASAQTDPVQLFASGKALLAKGDFQGALEAFKATTKADPENSEYFQEYALLRRVINIRVQLKDEEDAETWQKMSRALYNYYRQHNVDQEALATARALHEKAGSGESAALLAEAQLTAGDNAAAAALLGQLDEAQRSVQTDVLHGVALARLNKLDQAKAVAAKLELPTDGEGPLYFNAARLYALVGDADKALATLKSSFESTPPNQLDAVKADAKESRDLATLTASPAFASVLETKSTVAAAAGCGKDCGKCPSKGQAGCGMDKGKEAGCKEHSKEAPKEGCCAPQKK